VDLVTTCSPEITENTTGGEIGGVEDCATLIEEQLFTLAYTDTRNNPGKDSDGDNFLDHAVGAIETDFLTCFISGMEDGHCYKNHVIDSTAAVYNITLNVEQMSSGHSVNAAFPVAMRQQVLGSVSGATAKGATSITSVASVIAASGDQAGACAYFYDASGDNGWDRPIRISKTVEGGVNDVITFAEPGLLEDVVNGAKFVIAPLCVGRGDKFVELAPITLSCDTTVAAGECNFIFSGDTTLHGVLIEGPAIVRFDGATASLDMVHTLGCGDDDAPCIRFIDMQNVTMTCSTVVGGPVAGAGMGIEFSGVTNHVNLTDVATRYIGGDQFYADSSGSAMGTAHFERISCERIGYVGVSSGDSCLEDDGEKWTSVGVVDLFAVDPSSGVNGNIVQIGGASTQTATVNGMGIFGQTEGGLNKNLEGEFLKIFNVLGRGIVATRGTSKTWVGDYLSHCDIDDMYFNPTSGELGANDGTFENCIVKNLTIDLTQVFNPVDATGPATIRNNIFYNLQTEDGAIAEPAVIKITNAAGNAYVHTIENNTFIWDESSQWDEVIDDNEAATTNTINFGGNLVDGFDNDDGGTAIAIDLHSTYIDGIQYRAGRNNCVSNAVVTGGGTIEYVDDMGLYTTTPILGIQPDYEPDSYVLRSGSYLAEQKCGANTEPRAPGMGPGHNWLYQKMGIPYPEPTRVTNTRDGTAF
jgi:hypothetical protein